MLPSNRPVRVDFISVGSTQLLVGPASISRSLQIKVLSSARATSLGFDRARKEFGLFCSFNLISVPLVINNFVSRSNSWSEPSHHSIESGLVNSATSCTQASNFWLVVVLMDISILALAPRSKAYLPVVTHYTAHVAQLPHSRLMKANTSC